MKGIYLASGNAHHPNHDLVYQDINGKRDIGGDMLEIDLSPYDYIVATPPCNYWSRANYRRETSEYSQKTKHLLPETIDKLLELGKPFLVENVKNKVLYNKHGLLDKDCRIYFVGRHTFWTNVDMDDVIHDIKIEPFDVENKSRKQRQGDKTVHDFVELFINKVYEGVKVYI